MPGSYFAIPAVVHLKSGFWGKYLRFLLLVCAAGFGKASQAPFESRRFCDFDPSPFVKTLRIIAPSIRRATVPLRNSRNRKKFP